LLVPLLPLLLAGITLGAGRMPRALGIGSGRGAWAAGLVIVALLASAVPASSGWGRTARACDPPAREPSACPDRAEQAFFTAIEFLRDSIPAGAVVVSGRPATVFLLAGKRAVHYHGLRANDGVGVGRRMRAWGATYLLLGPFPPDQWRDLAPLLAAECAQFTVRTRPHPSVVLLEHGPAGGGRDDACDASSPHSPPTAHPAGDGQTSR
jgi:hypothetical protein